MTTIQKDLERLARYSPLEKLMERTTLPLSLLPEDVTHVLPSIAIGTDGLRLERLLLVTAKYLCDVYLDQPIWHFDVIAKATVKNYRFDLWTHEVKDGDVVKATFDVAQIDLLHSLGAGQFITRISYAGNERHEWLKGVVEAVPLQLVLGPDRQK